MSLSELGSQKKLNFTENVQTVEKKRLMTKKKFNFENVIEILRF